MHLDIITDDLEAETTRLEALGAQRVRDAIAEHGHRWIPMTDPEGNEFCICAC
jgi:predicted enzyme related to lactoylglutathione lyase